MAAVTELGRDVCLAHDALVDAEAAADLLGQDAVGPARLLVCLELLTRVELRARGVRAQASAHVARQLGGPGTYTVGALRVVVRRTPAGEWLVDWVPA